MVGVAVGVYSTIFIAIPVAYDFLERKAPDKTDKPGNHPQKEIEKKTPRYKKK
jgi:preprotein translocase subunit SecF